jgi:hypothetical protein
MWHNVEQFPDPIDYKPVQSKWWTWHLVEKREIAFANCLMLEAFLWELGGNDGVCLNGPLKLEFVSLIAPRHLSWICNLELRFDTLVAWFPSSEAMLFELDHHSFELET